VVIPSFNAGSYLREAVEGVLGQTYANLDVIVVDDGSTDGSVLSLKDIDDPRLRVLNQENSGKAVAMNHALAATDAEFFAINDADDISYPERIALQVHWMQHNPHLAAVFCGHDVIVKGKRMAPQFRAKSISECRFDIDEFRMPGHDPTPLYRRSLLGNIRFNPRLRIGQGYDFILRVGEQHPMVALGDCLYSYRIHPCSVTKQSAEVRSYVLEVLRSACERRGLTDFAQRWPPAAASRVGNRELDNNLAAHFIESVVDLRSRGRLLDALRTGLRCATLHPADTHYLKALAYALMPLGIVRNMRSIRLPSVPNMPS
jgi:glycosyltransferase involved in cell wall biosynthesis